MIIYLFIDRHKSFPSKKTNIFFLAQIFQLLKHHFWMPRFSLQT